MTPSNEYEKLYLPIITNIKEEEEENVEPMVDDDEPIKKKRGRPKGSIRNHSEVEVKHEEQQEVDPTSTDDETVETPAKRKRGRPRGSIASFKKEVKEEEEEEPVVNNDEEFNEPMKKKRGRPKGSIKSPKKEKNHQINIPIKEEKHDIVTTTTNHIDTLTKRKSIRSKSITKQEDMDTTMNEDEKLNESIKKKRGRQRASIKNEPEPKEEVITPGRRGRKRKIITEDNSNDENSKIEESDTLNGESINENANASIRRSARPRKPVAVDNVKNNSQVEGP